MSSDTYNDAYGDRRAIAVEIDSRVIFEGVYRKPITDAGTAYLDRLTWVARRHLVQFIGHLHPDRHNHVTQVSRDLIGNPSVLAELALEAWPVDPDDSLAHDGDTINT